MVRVKVCCISSPDEVRMAIQAGADALGLVASMPSGPGILDDARITELAACVPPPISRFLLTERLDVDGIVEHVERTGVDTVQICDHVDPRVLEGVRRRSGVRVVAVVHAADEGAPAYAQQAALHAHALLLDSGRPGADFKELGGTGRTHDWDVSAAIVAASPIPVWLAGGLRPSNVARAIRHVKPFGVDLCTGIRTDGDLDPLKLDAFMAQVRSCR